MLVALLIVGVDRSRVNNDGGSPTLRLALLELDGTLEVVKAPLHLADHHVTDLETHTGMGLVDLVGRSADRSG